PGSVVAQHLWTHRDLTPCQNLHALLSHWLGYDLLKFGVHSGSVRDEEDAYTKLALIQGHGATQPAQFSREECVGQLCEDPCSVSGFPIGCHPSPMGKSL